jgi:hypothetical protein
MNTQISTKLAALALALMMNSIMIGAVAYLLNGQIKQNTTTFSLGRMAAETAREAA